MSQRLYLLTSGIDFSPLHVRELASDYLMPPGGTPGWESFIAAIITGFLSYEGFHFGRKLPPMVRRGRRQLRHLLRRSSVRER